MYSIAFPEMFGPSKTKLYKDHEATISNLKLILLTTTRNCLYGDPNYGTDIENIIYDQNGVLLVDIIKDTLYIAIRDYIPQLKLERSDIKIEQVGTKLTATISAVNLIDYQTDLYTIELTDFSEK